MAASYMIPFGRMAASYMIPFGRMAASYMNSIQVVFSSV